MSGEYLRVIRDNNIFRAKVLAPPPPPPDVKPPPPLKEPPWELGGIWEPEPGVFEATIYDTSKKRGQQTLVVREGNRFLEYDGVVVITEVTADYVRYEIRDDKYNRDIERFLPPSAARTAQKLQKNWSGIIKLRRTNNYVVDMVRFEAECKKLAGEEGDWVEALIGTVKAEPYKPSGEAGPLQGYKVLEFGPESPLDELGVELQDVLVGFTAAHKTKKIADEAQGQGHALLKEALEQDAIGLDVRRLGRPVRIHIELKRY